MTRSIASSLVLVACLWATPARAQSAGPAGCTPYATHATEQNQFTSIQDPQTHAKIGTHVVLSGSVEIECNDIRLQADKVVVDTNDAADTSVLTATGNVVFIQGSSRILADHATFDLKHKTGTFYDASGSAALQPGRGETALAAKRLDRSMFGTQEPDAFFNGEVIEKLGPNTYRVTHGSFTTCVQPTPRWRMVSSSATITLREHASMHNVVLEVKDVPVFYLPYMYYPVKGNDRATGFLIPNVGSSSIRGFTLSNAFFWAINRSQDATFYDDWYSKIGQGYGAEYRYQGVGASNGDTRIYVVREHDLPAADASTTAPSSQFELRSNVNQSLFDHFVLQTRIDYFSSVQTQQLLEQNLASATASQRYVGANLFGSLGPVRVSAKADITDSLNGTSGTRTGEAPTLSASIAQAPIGDSGVYWGFNSEFSSLVRNLDLGQPGSSQGLSHVDVSPSIRASIGHLPYLSISTSGAWRYTYWTQSVDASGAQVAVPLSREMYSLQAQITGPTFSRIFDTPGWGYAARFKHVIEPSVTLNYLSNFADYAKAVTSDPTAQVLGGTSINYALTTRLLAKRPRPNGAAVAQQILSLQVSQTYYTNQNAAAYDPNYQYSLVTQQQVHLSPIAMQISANPTDVINGQARLEYNSHYHAMQSVSMGGGIAEPSVNVNVSWSKQFYVPGLSGFDDRTSLGHSLVVNSTVHAPGNRVSGTWAWTYDFTHQYMLQERFTGSYNTQCCGVAADFQIARFLTGLGPLGITADKRFTFSFTLAGLGTFSNPMGSFGG